MSTTAPAAPTTPTTEPRPSRLARVRGRLPKRRPLGPGMALFLLSPVVAELCSGATPPLSYVFFGWMLCLMYGGGAILIREAALRWGKGWPTILVLGLAYGIAEEGIAVRTFFDRTSPPLQPLGDFGWAGGVNWLWTTHLELYHAVISIAIPIFLVMLAYPGRRNEPWVSPRWLKKAAIGYVGVHLFWLVVYQRPVEGGYIFASLAAIALLVWIARRMPATMSFPFARLTEARRAPTPRRIALVAFAATFVVFWLDWGKGLGLSAAAATVAMLIIAAVAGWWFVRSSNGAGWTDRHRYALAIGVFAFLPVFSPFMDLAGSRGVFIVGIITGYLMRRTWRRLRDRETAREAAATATSAAVPDSAPLAA